MRVLSVNAGSSSLKLALIGERGDGRATEVDGQERWAEDPGLELLTAREIALHGGELDVAALEAALQGPLAEADAVGHRIVHGGRRFTAAVRIDAGVEAALRELADLAPLHQPKSLAALDAVSVLLPELPAVACFDTAFHASMPEPARTYALPLRWRSRWAIHRYGFHGLSHAWVARRVEELAGRTGEGDGDARAPLRIVSCHLGAGASLCAIAHGHSVDTTMGFTPLEGLVMATRSGSVDPGLMLWLIERGEASAGEVAFALEHESGLLGLCGSADMRVVLAGAADGDARCKLALDVYLHKLRSGIASMAASLGGVDALAFTGGVGERSAEVRARAIAGLGFLGMGIDAIDNAATIAARSGDREITLAGAKVRTFVIAAREDLEIVRQTRAVLGES